MTRAPLRRSDFGDGASYVRSLRDRGPTSADEIDAFVGLAGFDGALLSAIWGDRAAREAELSAETRRESLRRWHCFVEKFPSRSFLRTAKESPTLLTEAQVGEALSAAEFARAQGGLLDFSVTLTFAKMGATAAAAVEAGWRRYVKCLAQNLRDAGLPVAFIGLVEDAPSMGLHAHVLLNAPIEMRSRIAGWHQRFVRQESKARGVDFDATAIVWSRHRKRHPLLHDRLLHYALKGSDYSALVQVADASPDDVPVRLGDLLANEFQDPGVVPFERLVVGSAIAASARGTWRSKYEQGVRDVNELFDEKFVRWVRRRYPPPVPPRAHEIGLLVAVAEELFELIYDGDLARGPEAGVVVPNLEIAADALDRLGHAIRGYDGAAYGVAKRRALDTVQRSVRAAQSAVSVQGGRVYAVVCAGGGRIGVPELCALVRVQECLAALGERAGVVFVRAPWVLHFELNALAI